NNNIRNQMIFDGINDGDVFEKDIKDLTDEEIFSLFAKHYMNPGNGAWSFNEIVEKGKKYGHQNELYTPVLVKSTYIS
ncbi:MAG: hypothetical protein MJZ84_07350, partial [Paludibacteraceae bacterium]|nr:hypothetical protein [Paludibacteraceae bacterium]